MAHIATITFPIYVLQYLNVLFLQHICETPNFHVVTEDLRAPSSKYCHTLMFSEQSKSSSAFFLEYF